MVYFQSFFSPKIEMVDSPKLVDGAFGSKKTGVDVTDPHRDITNKKLGDIAITYNLDMLYSSYMQLHTHTPTHTPYVCT